MSWYFARAAIFFLTATVIGATQPWDAPFTSDTAAILSAARSLPVDDDPAVIVLVEEHFYTIDKQGRISAVVRSVYLIRRLEETEEWNSVEQEYQPWHENRPRIRARVIAPGGTVRTLDQSTIADAPARQYDSSIFSDRRIVRAPLPGIEAGAVVEVEIASSESRTQLGAGSARRVYIRGHVPLQRFRFSVNAERRIPVRTAVHQIPASAVQRQESGNSTKIQLELGPLDVNDKFEFNVPPDQSPQKHITFSTGESWQALAGDYARIVEEKIAAAELSSLLEGLDLTGSPVEVANRITARLHSRIRYTGVEFAEAEIIPGTPAQTLARGYGDCKDKSTLLVALLRAAGLDAHVALLAAGSQPDIEPATPGLGLFNHVVVFVNAKPPIWIDATAADTRVGVLPPADEGRLALIAKPDSTVLVTTPMSSSRENWQRRTTKVRMSDFGYGSFLEVTTAGGFLEAELRSRFGSDTSSARKQIEENTRKQLKAVLASFETSNRDDYSVPFRVSVEIEGVSAVVTGLEDGAVSIDRSLLFENLPLAAAWGLSDFEGGEDRRKSDVWFDQPYQIELRHEIHPPADFKPVSLPESKDSILGPAAYSQQFETRDDGVIELVYKFDSGKRRWTPAELEAFQDAAKTYLSGDPLLIRFIPRSAELTALGEARAALMELREFVESHPENVSARARLSRLLIASGLGDAADEQARRATEIGPESAISWLALGWALQHDAFGRRFRDNYSRADAVAALRRAVSLEPELWFLHAELAVLLEHNQNGVQYGPAADMDEAIQVYQDLLQKLPLLPLRSNLINALLRSGRLDEAKGEMARSGQGPASLLKVLQEGTAALVVDVQAKIPDPGARAEHLRGIGYILMQMRRYDLALPVFRASARISSQAPIERLLELFVKVERHEDAAPPADDPRKPVWEVLVSLLMGSRKHDELQMNFTTRDDWSAWRVEMDALRAEVRRISAETRQYGLGGGLLIDLILSRFNLRSEGEQARGFRISGDAMPSFFVVWEEGEYRILATSSNMAEIGKRVLGLLEKGDLQFAQWWLDQAKEGAPKGDGSSTPLIEMLWSGVTEEGRGLDKASTAAAALVGLTEKSDLAIKILQDARERATVSIEKTQLSVALAEALESAERWDALAEVAQSLADSGLFSPESFKYALRAAAESGDWGGLAGFARERLDKEPGHNKALRALAQASAHQQDLPGLDEASGKLLEGEYVLPNDLIFDAWMRRILGQAEADRLQALQTKAESYRQMDADFYYTQAMMQVELDHADEAIKSLQLAVGDLDLADVGPKAWFIQSRLAELLGFRDAAEEAKERARETAARDDMDRWALALLESSPTQAFSK